MSIYYNFGIEQIFIKQSLLNAILFFYYGHLLTH